MDPILSKLMDRSSTVELKVARIYDEFSVIFEGDPALSRFWALFAEAERYHSLIIQLQKHLLRPKMATARELADWERDIDGMIQYLDHQIDRLKKGVWAPDIAEAFAVADHIENQVLDAQAHSFRMVDESDMGEIVARLHEEDAKHRDKLLEARRRFDPSFTADSASE